MADLFGMLQAASGSGGGEPDPNFNQTVLLLHGDGTNGAQNNTFLDSSSNTFTITRNGNTTQGTFSPFSAEDGKWSNYFDGSGDYLSLASSADFGFGTGDFTIDFFVRKDTAWGTAGGTFNIIDSSSNITIFGGYSDNLAIALQGQAGSAIINTATAGMVANVWYQISVVRSSGVTTGYVNGTAQLSPADTRNYGTTAITIGSGADGGFKGYLSNFRIIKGSPVVPSAGGYTSALTADTNTKLLTCQSNRFVDTNTQVAAKALTPAGGVKVTPFSPFAPSAAYSASVNGGSGYFDGSGDSLATPNTSQFAPSGNFTIGFWVYPITLGTQVYVGNYTTNAGTDWSIETTATGTVDVYTNGITLRIQAGAGSLTTGQWQYISIVRASNTITLYVNGVSKGTYSQSGTFGTATKSIYIGSAASGIAFANGYISDVLLIDGSAVTTVPSAPSTTVSGTELLCNFTNAGIYNNALSGGVNLETVGNAQIDTTTKKYGTGSMEFDGTGDYLKIPSNQNLVFGTGDFTIEFWLYFDAVNNSTVKFIYDFRNASATSASILAQESTNSWTYFDGAGSNLSTGWTSGTFTTGTWYHIAICRSSGTTKFFVDGTSTSSVADTSNYANGTFILASRYNGQDYLDGFIDDLRITKGVARYTANFTPPDAPFPDL